MRSRQISAIVYPDSCPDIDKAIALLGCKKYAYIMHDRDVNEDGSPKKQHWHLIMCFDNVREFGAVNKELCCSENNIEPIKGKGIGGMLNYFLHNDDDSKAPYEIEEIFTCGINLDKYIAKSEAERASEVLDIILNCRANNEPFSIAVQEICKRDLYDVLRRAQTLYVTIYRFG